jgi:hypothetical protein
MKILRAIGFLVVVPLVACSSTQSDWSQANAANTVAAYQAFLAKHPDATQAEVARDRIHALQDEQAWARAQQANTVAGFQDYLQEQPSGVHVEEAKDRIASNERMTAWTAASTANTPEAYQSFLQKYPQGPEADQAKARLARLTGYRVQLASSRSEKQAEKVRDRMQDKYGDVLGSVVIVPGANANVHLVRSASMGESEANNACAKLKKDHLSCEVVRDANS